MPRTHYHNDVGVGLRSPHIDYFLEHSPPLSWLEVHSENYFQHRSLMRKKLERLSQQYHISCHGVGLSLGSVERIKPAHLSQLQHLVQAIDPIFVSDHLSWSQTGGHYFNDLLPLPYTEEALRIFSRNVLEVQDALKRPLLIENPSSYLAFNHSTIDEWTFLSEVQQRTDCRLLLDINNVHVSSFNHGFSCDTYLSEIPAHAVDEIHLAGFTKKQLDHGEIWIDTHNQPVSNEVWQLFREWVTKNGSRRTLIEWDSDLPEASVLLAEAEKAHDILEPFTPTANTKQTHRNAKHHQHRYIALEGGTHHEPVS